MNTHMNLRTHTHTHAEVIPTDNVQEAFQDIDVAILVGAMPRREGMLRKDLLKANVKIFETQGKALDQFAKKTVKVSVCLSVCVPRLPNVFRLCEEKRWNEAVCVMCFSIGVCVCVKG